MAQLTDTARLRRERIAILAIFIGAVIIGFAPILVRLSELGPMATGVSSVSARGSVVLAYRGFHPSESCERGK